MTLSKTVSIADVLRIFLVALLTFEEIYVLF